MENVYDIRYKKSLSYIISTDEKSEIESDKLYEKTAVVLYLYYEDTVHLYFKYINSISENIHLYIISSVESVLDKCREYIREKKRDNTFFILKENRGRDITALLIAMGERVLNYTYVAFVHDKKERTPEKKKDTDLWVENLWGNIIENQNYIDKVLSLFEKNEKLGVLAPPDPIGDFFCAWYGYGWHGSFEITKKLAEELELCADLDINKPPVALGTALWFRTKALRKLFEHNWTYLDFDDKCLNNSNYLSYGIERIFPYVAQDAGYDTGEIMTLEYAQKQNNYLHYTIARIFAEMHSFFPIPDIESVNRYKRNLPRLEEFVAQNENIYLYGAGNMGRFCLSLLRRMGRDAEAFIISDEPKEAIIDGVPVFPIDNVAGTLNSKIGVVITVAHPIFQNQILDKLKEIGLKNIFVFWR